MLAVMGVTGVGKTSFVNVAMGQDRVWDNSLESSTTGIQRSEPIPYYDFPDGREVVLLDTPGFDNADIPDIEVLARLVEYLKDLSREDNYLAGIIYLHRITDVRMTHSAAANIQLLGALCGEHFLPKVTLVTSMWDSIRPDLGADRERELANGYWSDFLENGAVYERYDGTPDAARRIIARYLGDGGSSVVRPSIAQQVIDEERLLQDSDAGRLALETLREKVKHSEQRLREARELQMYDQIAQHQAELQHNSAKLAEYMSGWGNNATSSSYSPQVSQASGTPDSPWTWSQEYGNYYRINKHGNYIWAPSGSG